MPKVVFVNDSVHMMPVVDRKNGRYLQNCSACSLMLGTMDVEGGRIACPRCNKVEAAPGIPVTRKTCSNAKKYKATRAPTCGCETCIEKWNNKNKKAAK